MSQTTTGAKPAIVGIEALTPIPANGSPNGASAGGSRRLRTVAAIIPCFNRRQDLELLLSDVARQDLRGIDLWCVVIDNASNDPLSTIKVPAGLRVEFVRLPKNTGGSGGFNAGMAHVLSGSGLTGELGPPEFVWWLDSDARVSRRCLRELVKVLVRRPKVGAVGSALHDISTGHTWEVGGRIVRRHGGVWPAAGGDVDERFLVRADYIAACSALVRRVAIEKTGLFPENFIYYDDVDWSIQMTAKTGLKVVGAPRSKAWHPPGNRRYVTWARYYIARNCFSHMDVMGMGGWKRFRRAMKEIPRAVSQAMMGLPELADLHLRGLQDALDRRFTSIEPKDIVKPVGFRPFTQLAAILEEEKARARQEGRRGTLFVHPILRSRIPGLETFRRALKGAGFRWPKGRDEWRRRDLTTHLIGDVLGAAWRFMTGPGADIAVTPTGWPTNWYRGRVVIQVTSEGLIVRRIERVRELRRAASTLIRGVALCVKIGVRAPHVMALPPAPAWAPARQASAANGAA